MAGDGHAHLCGFSVHAGGGGGGGGLCGEAEDKITFWRPEI